MSEVAAVVNGLDDAAPSAAVVETAQNPANSEAQTTTTEVDSGGDPEKPKGKHWAARKIDELTRRAAEADERARVALDIAQRMQQPQTQRQPTNQEPKRQDFDDYESYLRAHSEFVAKTTVDREWKARTEQASNDQRVEQARTEGARQAREFDARLKADAKSLPDFEEVVAESEVPAPPHVIAALSQSEIPAKVMHYLAKNPEVGYDLANMNPVQAMLKVGEITASLKAATKLTAAPPPGKPVGGKAPGAKSPEDMSDEEYRAYRTKGKK